MTKRSVRIVLLVILAAIALVGSLGPRDVSAYHRLEKVRIYSGPNATGDLLWTIQEAPYFSQPAWWIFPISPSYYPPVYTFTEDAFYEGNDIYGPILFSFHHDVVYIGPNFWGPALFNLRRGRYFEGRSTNGQILYTLGRQRVFEGPNPTGEILLNTTMDIEAFSGPLDLVLGILLSEELPAPQLPPPVPTPPPPPPPPF